MSTNIAMWSGPRNISTAMMYCFGNRPDCVAWDEPFYAFSLVHHGNDHPMRDEIIAADDKDWDSLVAKCLGAAPKPVFYQKHMTHHMLKGWDRSWINGLTNAFLIRAPERVLTSYTKKWSDVTLRDIGFVEQAEIFDMVAQQLGHATRAAPSTASAKPAALPSMITCCHGPRGPSPSMASGRRTGTMPYGPPQASAHPRRNPPRFPPTSRTSPMRRGPLMSG